MTGTPRDPYTRPREAQRRGGNAPDCGPGNTSLPGAQALDRPSTPNGAFGRTGTNRTSTERGIRKIQDADKG